METSILIPTNDISRYVNEIVEIIPDNEFKHHRGATSYHSKMITRAVYYLIHKGKSQFLSNNF